MRIERILVAMMLVGALGACAPAGSGDGASPAAAGGGSPASPVAHADEHAGHDHGGSPAVSGGEHAGHSPAASPVAHVDEHAGHDHGQGTAADLDAKMGSNPDPPVAGESAEVGFLVTRQGQPVRDYDVVHEKKAHLIVVSADLADFQHLHPELDEQGAWIARAEFPNPGLYRLYLDVKPTGGEQQVLRSTLTVPGSTPDRPPLRPAYGPVQVDGVEVAMERQPSHLHVADATLTFRLARDGKPVTDLQPYLGAMGHLVIVDQSGERFLHAHPVEGGQGDAVAFHTAFPAPGLYKLWAQFQVGGKVLTAPFVVHVQ